MEANQWEETMNIQQLTDICNEFRLKLGAETTVDELVFEYANEHLHITPTNAISNEKVTEIDESPDAPLAPKQRVIARKKDK
jgi:hypothetical protein